MFFFFVFFYVPVICSSLSMPPISFRFLSNIMLPALGLRSTCDGIVDALRFPLYSLGRHSAKSFIFPIFSHEAVKLKSCSLFLGMLCHAFY